MSLVIKFSKPERKRTYHFPGGNRHTFFDVTSLFVSDSGQHYINHGGKRHDIVSHGWIRIELDIDEWDYPKQLNE